MSLNDNLTFCFRICITLSVAGLHDRAETLRIIPVHGCASGSETGDSGAQPENPLSMIKCPETILIQRLIGGIDLR